MRQVIILARLRVRKGLDSADWRAGTLLASLCLLLPGCSRGGPPIVPVFGTVSLNGKPLAEGCVCFASATGYATSAPLEPDGSFRLVSQYGSGIPPGTYRVTIVPRPEKGLGRMIPKITATNPATVIPTKYQYVHSSDLTAVVSADSRIFGFDLKTGR